MKKPLISMIAAIGKDTRVLGKNNQLLWKISEDLKRFKALTTGHPIIMGRKTFESIGRALPNRTNIIVTRNKDFTATGCVVVHSLEEAFKVAREKDNQEVFVIGGGELYGEALPSADRLYLTLVESNLDGDTFFPVYSSFKKIISTEEKEQDGLRYSFVNIEK